MDKINPAFNNKNILITGGGGYLGSQFLKGSYNPQANYYLLDLQFNELSKSLAATHRNVRLIEADITDFLSLMKNLTPVRPDLIFHFAALLDRSRDFSVYEKLYSVNVTGTLNLLKIFKDVPYEKFFYASTSEVYGSVNPVPFNETQSAMPLSPYSLTKLMAEEMIRTFSDIYNKPWTITRIFNFFGPDMPEATFIPQLVSAWKDDREFQMTPGEQKRDFLFIDDVVHYLTSLAGLEDLPHQIVNICSGKAMTMKEIAEKIVSVSGGKLKISPILPYRPNELWNNTGDNAKLLSLLPYHPIKRLEDWILETFSVSS